MLIPPLAIRVATWEASLRASYRVASVIGELKLRIAALARDSRNTDDSIKMVMDELSRELGRAVPPTQAGLEGAMAELQRRSLLESSSIFERAAAAGFDHFQTQRTMSKLCLAAAAIPDGHDAERRLRAWKIAESIARRSDLASAWSWAATVRSAIPADGTIPPGEITARECLVRAAALSPHEPSHPQRLALMLKNDDPANAAAWAAKALDADEQLRLDPLRRFTAREREELLAIARASQAPR
jgi:hypothetical protein